MGEINDGRNKRPLLCDATRLRYFNPLHRDLVGGHNK